MHSRIATRFHDTYTHKVSDSYFFEYTNADYIIEGFVLTKNQINSDFTFTLVEITIVSKPNLLLNNTMSFETISQANLNAVLMCMISSISG